MTLKRTISNLAPEFLRAKLLFGPEQEALAAVPTIACSGDRLAHRRSISLSAIFNDHEIEASWAASKSQIDIFTIPDGSGGVNPGDRRAIYYLISHFRPSSVLEIGTHIGASTLHIAAALDMTSISKSKQASLTTVDVLDVNDAGKAPWQRFGTDLSPREMVSKINDGSFVEFVTDTSLHYAANCGRKFDFIFLDGDHSGPTVYREIPAVLPLLTDHGVILLHDYFPMLKPLWSDGSIIPGPRLATQRFAKEKSNFVALPLGALPWPTKRQSNVTSLALLVRNQ